MSRKRTKPTRKDVRVLTEQEMKDAIRSYARVHGYKESTVKAITQLRIQAINAYGK